MNKTTDVKNFLFIPKNKWKIYWHVFRPIIFGSILFALNGFVDNFMVGHIDQGVASLSSANSWTNIYMGMLVGTAGSGSVLLAQAYFSKDYKKAQMYSKIRFICAIIIAIIFSLLAWTMPTTLNEVFLKKPTHATNLQQAIKDWKTGIAGANSYIKFITLQWLGIALTFNLGNQFREIGYGRVTMYWGIATLSTNIIFNSIFMYVLNTGVEGAAFATFISRMVALIIGITFILKKRIPIFFKPWEIFRIDKEVWKSFFKRWIPFFSLSTTIFFITFRNYFYDSGYPTGSIADGVGGLLVLGLTGAIMNIFVSTFNALSAMASNFVASELGKNNIKQAKQNANELKVFNSFTAFCGSLMLLIVAFCVPYFRFLSKSEYADAHLENVKWSLMVIAFWYPIWIWFSTSYRNALSGGKGNWFAFVDWFVSGPIQLLWAYITMDVIVPQSVFLQNNFWCSYFIFFCSDIFKLIFQEILYYKTSWAFKIDNKTIKAKKMAALDDETILDKQP